MKNLKSLAAALVVTLAAATAQAFPIAAAGTEGFSVVVSSTSNIIAKYEGNSAAYSNNLWLSRPSGDLFIFNNHGSSVGDTVDLGSFAVGTELIFRLQVTNTGENFYTGPGSRNSDGFAHARVQTGWATDTTLVSFEDLKNGPFDFNDLSFSFTNTAGSPTVPPAVGVPDAFSTFSGLSMALAGMIFLRRKRA